MATKTQTQTRPARQGAKKREERAQDKKAERLEWIVAAISSVIVLGLTGFILYEAVTKTGSEPDIRMAIERGVPMTDGYVVEITVRNDGHATVSDVQIEGTAELGDGETETGNVTINYLPAASGIEVGLGFSREVDPEQVTLRVLGYSYP